MPLQILSIANLIYEGISVNDALFCNLCISEGFNKLIICTIYTLFPKLFPQYLLESDS